MRELFSRNWAFISPELQQKLSATRLLIAGTGLGGVIAALAVRTGFCRLLLADGDCVEPSNLNRQIFDIRHIDVNKARAAKQILLGIHPDAEIEAIESYLTPDTLETPIQQSDLVVNTIDWDDPAFMACNRIARRYGKFLLFPMNIGWGGALYVFAPSSPTIEEMFGFSSDPPPEPLAIKRAFVKHAIGADPPPYLREVLALFEISSDDNWPYDPQLGIGAATTAALTLTTAVSILAGQPIRVTPEVIRVDLTRHVQGFADAQ